MDSFPLKGGILKRGTVEFWFAELKWGDINWLRYLNVHACLLFLLLAVLSDHENVRLRQSKTQDEKTYMDEKGHFQKHREWMRCNNTNLIYIMLKPWKKFIAIDLHLAKYINKAPLSSATWRPFLFVCTCGYDNVTFPNQITNSYFKKAGTNCQTTRDLAWCLTFGPSHIKSIPSPHAFLRPDTLLYRSRSFIINRTRQSSSRCPKAPVFLHLCLTITAAKVLWGIQQPVYNPDKPQTSQRPSLWLERGFHH